MGVSLVYMSTAGNATANFLSLDELMVSSQDGLTALGDMVDGGVAAIERLLGMNLQERGQYVGTEIDSSV